MTFPLASRIITVCLAVIALPGASACLAETAEQKKAREQMAERQIAARGIESKEVLNAMRQVPRHKFVPESMAGLAYDDNPLPIGHGQTISQPYIVAYMTEHLEAKPKDKVLEIGTGSGYQAAILSEIVDEVYTIEIIPELAKQAKQRLAEMKFDNVHVKHADGYHGWEEHAPFDAIIVTAAAPYVPPPLKNQLKPGGRMIIPVGTRMGHQQLVVLTKEEDGSFSTNRLIPVRFVPFTRQE